MKALSSNTQLRKWQLDLVYLRFRLQFNGDRILSSILHKYTNLCPVGSLAYMIFTYTRQGIERQRYLWCWHFTHKRSSGFSLVVLFVSPHFAVIPCVDDACGCVHRDCGDASHRRLRTPRPAPAPDSQ